MPRQLAPPDHDDQLPPHDDNAELALLGCILENNSLMDEARKLGVDSTSFYSVQHQKIWGNFCFLAGNQLPINPDTYLKHFQSEPMLAACQAQVEHWQMMESYIKKIQGCQNRRLLVTHATRVAKLAGNTRALPAEIQTQTKALMLELEHTMGNNGAANDLDKLAFDPLNPPPDEPILLSIAGIPCATPGNISTLTAQKKSGKTAFLSAITAASFSPHGDTLGVKAFNHLNKLVLHFDTEQSAMDHWKLCDSILRRAMLTESPIFKSFCLTSLPILKRQEIIHQLIRRFAPSGIFIVLIDGVGDLVRNVNDPNETADFVASLHSMAITSHSHILNALHLNPGSDFKSRGHLGSELERKSQTNLRLEKTENTFVVWADDNRGAPISKSIGPTFSWNDDKKMHTSSISHLLSKSDALIHESQLKLAEAFRLANKTALHYSDLINALLRVPGIKSTSSAERLFRSAKFSNLISKNLINQWSLS